MYLEEKSIQNCKFVTSNKLIIESTITFINSITINPLPNRYVQTIDEATYICFRHAGGNFSHRAQQVYQNAVDEAMGVYMEKDETILFTRMTKDHTLIDNVIEAVRASIPMYCVLQKKKGDAFYSIKDRDNEFENL